MTASHGGPVLTRLEGVFLMTSRTLFTLSAENEEQVLSCVNMDEAWTLVEKFAGWKRHSSTNDEFASAEYIASRLTALGVPHKKNDANLYLSLPVSASAVFAGKEYKGKAPSFSASTPKEGVTGQMVYLPAVPQEGYTVNSELKAKVSGKIVIIDWPPAGEIITLQMIEAGAKGLIFAHPGVRIHEDTCTTIWGSPEMTSKNRIPIIPVVAVNKDAGAVLLEAAKGCSCCGPEVTLHACTDTGWKKTMLVVAEIPGSVWPDEFVLLHGHLDSWYEGIGDNAVGDGAMLEIARVLWQNRAALKRSVRIAWWTGHSTGRYAGSTWWCDHNALDIVENCVAHLNCDSPGCRWATDLTRIPAMSELIDFVKQVVKDMSGQDANPGRIHRAGDCSFNNLGVSSAMMLSSAIPQEVRNEKGMYGVGGCGGNNEWHTEDDGPQIADKNYLLRDTKLYTMMVWRLCNLAVHPENYGATALEIASFAEEYGTASSCVKLDDVAALAKKLAGDFAEYYEALSSAAPEMCDCMLEQVNSYQRQIARHLVEANYTSEGKFHLEAAAPIPAVPDLAWAKAIAISETEDEKGFLAVSLTRGKNKVMYALQQAEKLLCEAKTLIS
jgi:N-acetylated-alpha-linked acidic dipeptidase